MATISVTSYLLTLVSLLIAAHLVSATDRLSIQEGNGTVVLSVTAQPGVLLWNSSTEDALYTCEASVLGSDRVRLLDVNWLPPEGLQRSDYGIRWEETNSTNWQGQQLTETVTLRLRNAVPEDAGTYNCSVTYQQSVGSSTYHVWTTTRLEVNEEPPATGELLLNVSLVLAVAAGAVTVINVLWCFCKMKKRVRDPSEPDKRRKTSGAHVKRRNSISPVGISNRNSPEHSSRQPLPQINAVPSISIIEAGVQESQIDAIEQHLQQLDDIPEDHEVVSVRPTRNSARKAQEALVRNTDVRTTDMHVDMHVPGKLITRDDRKTKVSSPTDDRSEQLDLDVDDQRACSGGSRRSTGSSGYGSLPPSPRTRPAIPRSDRNMLSPNTDVSAKQSPAVQVNTWVNTNVLTEDEHSIDHHQANVQNETVTSIPHENATENDRQSDLKLFNKLSLDQSKLIREGNIPLRVQLQTNFSSNNFASGVFDHTGGHLSLPRHDINLFIPPGALEHGQFETIHIFVSPSMNRGKPAPVVHCGPTGTTFLDHVILSFPVDPKYDKIIPKFTNTEVGSEEEWKPLLEDDDAASIVQNGKCTLFLPHFTGFGAEGAEEGASPGIINADDKKIIRVGAFAAKHTSDDDLYQLRIRIYDASAAASERIYNKERELFGGRLLDDDKRMLVYRCGGALCVKMCDISRGWRAVDDSDENQRIEVGQIWDGSDDTDASCTIRLENVNPNAPMKSVWSTVSLWQEEAHGQTVTLKPSDTIEMSRGSETPDGALSPTQAFLHRELEDVTRPSQRSHPILPPAIRHEICVKLDVKNAEGNDWRRMAAEMGFSTDQRKWLNERCKSPTSKLLDFWETQNVSGGIVALQRLCDLYKEMKRPDVKDLVEKVLSSGGLRDSGYGNSVESGSASSQATPNGSQATLNQSVASESCFETTSVEVLNNMPLSDV